MIEDSYSEFHRILTLAEQSRKDGALAICRTLIELAREMRLRLSLAKGT